MTIAADLRYATRVFRRSPGVPLTVATLFALGVGMASGMWAVIDAALFRPLPYRDGRSLVVVLEAHPQRGLMAVAPANFLDWGGHVQSLQDVSGGRAVDVSVAGTGLPVRAARSPARPVLAMPLVIAHLTAPRGRSAWRRRRCLRCPRRR
jgi:hypothetical protein